MVFGKFQKFQGTVVELLPNAMFRVRLDNDHEILAHTDAPLIDSVELFNPTDRAVDLHGWTMTDDRRAPAKFRFGANTTIAPGGYLVVTSDTLGFALSELGEYEGQEVVVRCVDVDSSPHCGGNLCEEDE